MKKQRIAIKEVIFKAKTSVNKGLYINGAKLTSSWTQFKNSALYYALLKQPDVQIEVFSNGKWAAPTDVADISFENMTREELKTYAITNGARPSKVGSMGKEKLIALCKELKANGGSF